MKLFWFLHVVSFVYGAMDCGSEMFDTTVGSELIFEFDSSLSVQQIDERGKQIQQVENNSTTNVLESKTLFSIGSLSNIDQSHSIVYGMRFVKSLVEENEPLVWPLFFYCNGNSWRLIATHQLPFSHALYSNGMRFYS